MLVAILPTGRGTESVFVKLTADRELAAEHRERLVAFISSLEW